MFCSKCGCEIENEAVFCKKCGFKLIINENSTNELPKLITNNCSNCGANLKKLSKTRYICEYCGSEFFTSSNMIVKSKISEQEIMNVLHRAATFEIANKFYEELQCLLSISDKVADNAFVLVKIGRAYRRNNMFDKAIEYYQQAIDVNSVYATAYSNLGAIYILIEDFTQAEKYLKTAIDLINENRASYSKEDYATTCSNYAISIGKQGRKDEAKHFLDIAEKNGYTNGNAVRKIIKIKRGIFSKFF